MRINESVITKASRRTQNLKNVLDGENVPYTAIIQNASISNNRIYGNIFDSTSYVDGLSIISNPIYEVDIVNDMYKIRVKSGSVYYISSFKKFFNEEAWYINEC